MGDHHNREGQNGHYEPAYDDRGGTRCDNAAAHLLTLSKPDGVRIEIHAGGGRSWVEGSPADAIDNAWCILDSARRAVEKAGRVPPTELLDAMKNIKGLEP